MSAVSAATHAPAPRCAKLRAAALQAGKDTQYSATQAADGITQLSKAGVSTANILGGGLKGALSLAAAGQIDVGEAAETAASAMTQFKLSGDQVPHVADLLAAAAGKAQGSVHDMGYGAEPVGPGRLPVRAVDRGHHRRAGGVRQRRPDRLRRRHVVQDDVAGDGQPESATQALMDRT
jgi:TP901 family phage tail tape measure protein